MLQKISVKFFQNNDTPVYAYKRFMETNRDNYPVFTFCIENRVGMNNQDYLNNFGINGTEYQRFLKGEKVDAIKEVKFITIDFDKSVIKVGDLLIKFKTIGQNTSGGGDVKNWIARKEG